MKPLLTLTSLLCTLNLLATSYPPPQEKDVYSENKKFVLHINPETKIHSVFDTLDRNKELWSFSKYIWLEPCFLSNDGKSVLMTSWRYVRASNVKNAIAIYLFTEEGLTKQHTLKEVCPRPYKTYDGPIGSFWRTWYTNITYMEEDVVAIKTTSMYDYQFSIKDGSLVNKKFVLSNVQYKVVEIILIFLAAGAIVYFTRKIGLTRKRFN